MTSKIWYCISFCISDKIYYTYDASNKLVSMNLNGVEYYYIRNVQGDIIGLFDKTGTQVVSYSYDSWGKLISIDGSLKDSVGVKNPYRYRGYRYDTETGLYYLQSRYYNAEWGRFINADGILGQTGQLLSHNTFCYCQNNCVNMIDIDGLSPIYVFYYNDSKKGFSMQAMNSPYFDIKSNDVKMIGVNSSEDFINSWNAMEYNVKDVYLYLHGGTGALYFKGNSITYNGKCSFSQMQKKHVEGKVNLFSCDGGHMKKGKSVATTLAKLTGTKVLANSGHVSYMNVFGKYYARSSFTPKYFGTWMNYSGSGRKFFQFVQ